MSNLRITPIGTCRIHGPLTRGSLRHPVELEMGRNYGFVHTASEALQLIRFLNGEEDIPAQAAPLIVNGGDVSEFESESWSPADLHIVEISSAKKLLSGNHPVQINYIYRHFADFFANRERSRVFWNLLRAGHRADFVSFVRGEAPYKLLSREDRDLLLSIGYEQQSFRSIKDEMAEIVDRLGQDKLIFVTHVNAKTPDDEIIPSRDRLIRWVKLAGEQLGVKVFDPTAAMEELGQELAMDNGGLDLTHYTPGFSDRVYDELHRFHIAEMMGSALEGEVALSDARKAEAAAAHFESMLQIGDFFETAREIHAAIARSPDSQPLIQLRGIIRARIGDYAGAVADLGGPGDDKSLSRPTRLALLNALTAVGNFEQAVTVANNLISEEYEDAQLYAAASEAAEQLGRHQQATQFAKQSFRLDRTDLAAALRALKLLIANSGPEEIAQWREELLENIGESSNGVFELCQWAVENRDDGLFAAAIARMSSVEKAATVELVQDAYGAGMYDAVASSIAVLVDLGRLVPALAKARAALLEEILEESARLFESGQKLSGYRCAKAIAALADVEPVQIRTDRLVRKAELLIRTWIASVRAEVREASQAGKFEEVARIAEQAGDLVSADAVTVVLVARALHDLGRTGEALNLLKAVQSDQTDEQNYRRWTGRIAALADDYVTALEMFGDLRRDDSIPAALRAEADRFFASIQPRALKQLRNLVMADKFDDAFVVAKTLERHTSDSDRVRRELIRMSRRLLSLLLNIERGEGDQDDREWILRLILRIRPEDQAMLRRLALELMRQFRFAEAAEIWHQIRHASPDDEAAGRALNRCEALARRRSASLAA